MKGERFTRWVASASNEQGLVAAQQTGSLSAGYTPKSTGASSGGSPCPGGREPLFPRQERRCVRSPRTAFRTATQAAGPPTVRTPNGSGKNVRRPADHTAELPSQIEISDAEL